MILPFAAATAIVGVGYLWRRSHIRRIERECLERRPIGPDGIVIGGEPFEHHAPGECAVLLVHGGGDTPQTVRYLAAALHERGYGVRALLLPGHGRTVRHFIDVSPDRWLDAVRDEYNGLRTRYPRVGVIGVSMGGALAVQLAAEIGDDLPVLGLVAPYLAAPHHVRRAARLSRLWGSVVPYVRSTSGLSIHDPEEAQRNRAYGIFTPAALRALVLTADRAAALLPRVGAPTLVIQSRQDNRIAVDACERAFASLGAREKRLVWTDGAGHIITVDHGREQVIALLVEWVDRWLAAGGERTERFGERPERGEMAR